MSSMNRADIGILIRKTTEPDHSAVAVAGLIELIIWAYELEYVLGHGLIKRMQTLAEASLTRAR
jgi:hypothetical protein